jgi:hypothetical protein
MKPFHSIDINFLPRIISKAISNLLPIMMFIAFVIRVMSPESSGGTGGWWRF